MLVYLDTTMMIKAYDRSYGLVAHESLSGTLLDAFCIHPLEVRIYRGRYGCLLGHVLNLTLQLGGPGCPKLTMKGINEGRDLRVAWRSKI